MSKINRILMMIIAMVTIMIAAVVIDKGYNYYESAKWEKERVAVYEQARADIEQMQSTIQTLSQDQDALISYIEENELNYVESYEEEITPGSDEQTGENTVSDNEMEDGNSSDGHGEDYSISDNALSDNSVSDNAPDSGNTVSDNEISDNTVSGNTTSEGTSSGGEDSEGSVSDNTVSENTVSGNSVSGNSVSSNTVSDNTISGNSVSGNQLMEKKICASYEETIKINQADKQVIVNSTLDFSEVKIACLGDSITGASNLDNKPDYEQLSYPYQLRECLGAEEVVNLGIGGSSIGRYWDKAFVDRYQEIPKDTDLIIVMGGTNDGFCATEKELGALDDLKPRTFAGDLDELLQGLKKDYPDAVIVLATPLPNVLHDMLRKDREYLLPQSVFAKMIKQIGEKYQVPVVDLYGSQMLDTHDAAVIHNFMPDGVHGNEDGYRILAEHFAAEIIKLYEEKEQSDDTAEF